MKHHLKNGMPTRTALMAGIRHRVGDVRTWFEDGAYHVTKGTAPEIWQWSNTGTYQWHTFENVCQARQVFIALAYPSPK